MLGPYLGEERRAIGVGRSEEHTSELQSRLHLVCRLPLVKKKSPWRIGVSSRLVVMGIGCPCRLVIATPVSILRTRAGSGRRARFVEGRGGPARDSPPCRP